MPRDTTERHTVESLRHNAREIERLLTQLRASIDLMQLDPGLVDAVNVPRERSRVDGITFLRSWTDAVRDAVSDEKHKRLRDEPKGPSVSDSPDTLLMPPASRKNKRSKGRPESPDPKASDTRPAAGMAGG